MRQFYLIKVILFLPILVLSAGSLNAQDEQRVEYLSYDVEITLDESGDFTVREIQQVRYGDEFREGFAEIPLDYLTDISGIAVYGGPDLDNLSPYDFAVTGPNTFSLEQEGNTLFVEWEYEPTLPGDELTFVIEYLVEGGLWIYPDSDLLEWRAIAADRSGLTVPESRVTVNLPWALEPEDLDFTAFGPTFSADTQPTPHGQQVIFTNDEPLLDGTAFQILIGFPHGLVASTPQSWQLVEDQAELQYRITAVDVEMVLDDEGNLRISEHQQVLVEEGTMYEGFRRFNWLFLEGLDEFFVRESGVPFGYVGEAVPLTCEDCFTMSFENRSSYWTTYDRIDDEVEINDFAAGGGEVTWRFPPLVKGEQTAFDLDFVATGTVSINEEDQKLHWTILPGYDVPVEKATARLSLPNRLGLEDVVIEGAGIQQSEHGTILLTLDEPATDWSIQVTLPAGTTSAEKPAWQIELEEVFAEAEAHRERLAREKVALGSGGLLVLVAALLGGLTAWYLIGSRKWREVRGKYRTTPPSDLSPGLVAYLIDGKATATGALATLLHLATLGLIRIDLKESFQLERISTKEKIDDNEKLETITGDSISIEPHMAYLYNSLVADMPLNTTVHLDSLLGRMKALLPEFYMKMGRDLIIRYHKQGGLQKARRLPRRALFVSLMLLGALFVFSRVAPRMWYRFTVVPFPNIAPFVVVLLIVIIALLGWWFISSQKRSTLTKEAKNESKRWLGFKAYLQDIQDYGDLAEAQEILDRYFDYAVALNVEEQFVQQVKDMGGFVPIWLAHGDLDDGSIWEGSSAIGRPWYVRPWYRRGSWRARPARPYPSTGGLQYSPDSDGRPSLQRMSDDLNGSLSTASRSLTGVLNAAVGEGSEPVKVSVGAFGSNSEMEWSPETPVDQVVGDIMRKTETIRPPRPSRSSGGGFRGGSGGSRMRSSSRRSSRSSSSRRSGGGGRRGFR